MDNLLGVCFQTLYGVHLLPHGRIVLSVGPQLSGQSLRSRLGNNDRTISVRVRVRVMLFCLILFFVFVFFFHCILFCFFILFYFLIEFNFLFSFLLNFFLIG